MDLAPYYLSRVRSSDFVRPKTATSLFVTKVLITNGFAREATYRRVHVGAIRAIHDVAFDHGWIRGMTRRSKEPNDDRVAIVCHQPAILVLECDAGFCTKRA